MISAIDKRGDGGKIFKNFSYVEQPIYFYCAPDGSPEQARYHYGMITLAEGLKELHVPFVANRHYWKESEYNTYLFRHDPDITPDDCAIVVIDHCWMEYNKTFPPHLFHPSRTYSTVYIDYMDLHPTMSWNHEFRAFDYILKTHWNNRISYPSNFLPWAFGLSNRMIREVTPFVQFKERARSILVNYRVEHQLRMLAHQKFLRYIEPDWHLETTIDDFHDIPREPYHRLQWEQTGRRHYPSYYQRLQQTMMCACFGGFFQYIMPSVLDQKFLRGIWYRLTEKYHLIAPQLIQWDSWRLWEAWVAGCVVLHVDLKKYHAVLPAMPENWQHYIGIDLEHPSQSLERIQEETEDSLGRIAKAGTTWAMAHYSPTPVALRFLELVLKKGHVK